MEPHWNPMVEVQAAARVDRLDQTKDIVIHRYIVKESFEEVTFPLHPFVQFILALLTASEQNIQNLQRRKLQDVELSHSSMATGDDPNEDSSVLVGVSKLEVISSLTDIGIGDSPLKTYTSSRAYIMKNVTRWNCSTNPD
jgi:hypothetical protein